MNLLFIFLGLLLLIFGGDWLLKAAVSISIKLQIPKIVIGMTVVSFATSAPELIVSIRSALQGYADLSIGNVIGSNIANIAFVLGITLLISKINVTESFYKTDWPIMMLASTIFFVFFYFDGYLSRYEGIVFVLLLIAMLFYLFKYQKTAVIDEEDELDEAISQFKTILYTVMGAVALWGGSELLINGAINLAQKFQVSERIIGATVVSIGTSIPELAASIIAVVKKEKAISLGNLLGSNVFNILAVLGITSIVHPIKTDSLVEIREEIWWMIGVALLVWPLSVWLTKKRLDRIDGIILLVIYILFVYRILI